MPDSFVPRDSAAGIAAPTVVSHGAPALCVDLDGTLIATDMLWESTLQLLRTRPMMALRYPFWLMAGRTVLKHRIAEQVEVDPAALPYRPEVLDLISAARRDGRTTVLATATDARLANAVAAHLGLFDEVFASDGVTNMKGSYKGETLCNRFGKGNFDYMGDAAADLAVWKSARRAYVVCAPASLARQAAAMSSQCLTLGQTRPTVARALLKAMRPQQAVKNILLAIPLLASHRFTDPHKVLALFLAFIAFTTCASGVYLLNDLLDVQSDRRHPRKRNRPLASGALPIPTAAAMIPLLLAGSVAIALLGVGVKFAAVLLCYVALTTAYTFYIKRRLVLDVIALAGLYTLRIFAGGVATGVVVSSWLAAFSMFIFVSLAFAKRYAELRGMEERDQRVAHGRSYITDDIATFESCGPASGYLAVLIFCLYIQSETAAGALYQVPEALWAICPVLLYWITRVWFLARRRVLDEDPIAFAVRDRHSHWAMAVVLLAAVVAAYGKTLLSLSLGKFL